MFLERLFKHQLSCSISLLCLVGLNTNCPFTSYTFIPPERYPNRFTSLALEELASVTMKLSLRPSDSLLQLIIWTTLAESFSAL